MKDRTINKYERIQAVRQRILWRCLWAVRSLPAKGRIKRERYIVRAQRMARWMDALDRIADAYFGGRRTHEG